MCRKSRSDQIGLLGHLSRMQIRRLGALAGLLAFSPLSHAYVQGLGAAASASEKRPCEVSGLSMSTSRRFQTSLRGGVSTAFNAPIRNSFSLELDAGLRAGWIGTGCVETTGLFGFRSWTEHSLMVLVDAELPVLRLGESLVGAKVGWNVRGGSSGGLVTFPSFISPQLTVAAGPSFGAGRWGIGASIAVRLVLELRIALTVFPGGATCLGVHLGLSDLHGLAFD
jgi:hypothetical protein